MQTEETEEHQNRNKNKPETVPKKTCTNSVVYRISAFC